MNTFSDKIPYIVKVKLFIATKIEGYNDMTTRHSDVSLNATT
jgi:hypothetical protein